MIERELRTTPGGIEALLVDSVSFVQQDDEGMVVVCASHGGESSGQYASQRRPSLIFFNDAGIGKDQAGIYALELLANEGLAAVAVSSDTARIGDVLDHWASGRVSHVNTQAIGIKPNMSVVEAIDAWAASTGYA